MVTTAPIELRHPPKPAAGITLSVVLYAAAAAMLGLSLYYWKLRSGFSDTPNYIVNMTRKDGFEVAHYRYVSILHQWLPYTLLKLRAPLRAIAIAYSFAYTLAPVAMMVLALRWLRQPATALAILLQFTLMNALLFYYTCSELQLGLGLLLLYNGILDHYIAAPQQRRRSFAVASVLLLPTILFAHPMCVPVLGCWLLFRVVCRRQSWRTLGIVIACLALSYLVKRIWFVPPYEAEKGLTWEIIRPFGLNYLGGGLSRSFYHYLRQDAFLVPVVALMTIVLLVRQRNWRMLLTMLGAGIGLYLLVIIAFEDLDGMHIYDHYHEHYMQPAILFLLLGFSDAVFRQRTDPRITGAALGLVFLISLAKINSGSAWLAYRQKWELSYLKLMDGLGLKKAVAGRVWAPEGIWKGSFWSSANETLLLSAMDGPEHAKTLFLVWNIGDFREPYQSTDQILQDGITYPQASLPARYFRLNDKPYVILEQTVPDSVLAKMRWP